MRWERGLKQGNGVTYLTCKELHTAAMRSFLQAIVVVVMVT